MNNNETSQLVEQNSDEKTFDFKFTGTGLEYCKIWFSNLALSILSVGIYSAWAKVKREKYLLASTVLDGSTFTYTADPVKILKGRFIAMAFFIIYSVVSELHIVANLIGLAILMCAFPWILASALRFRARYTQYRGMPFHHKANTFGIFKYSICSRIIGFLAFGFLIPWARFKERSYFVNQLHYGKQKFSFNGELGSFYLAYLIPVISFTGLFLIFGLLAAAANEILLPETISAEEQSKLIKSAVAFSIILAFILISLFFQKMLGFLVTRATLNATEFAGLKMSCKATLPAYLLILVTNTILFFLSMGLATPWCTIRIRRFLVNSMTLTGNGNLGEISADTQRAETALGGEAADLYDLDLDFGF